MARHRNRRARAWDWCSCGSGSWRRCALGAGHGVGRARGDMQGESARPREGVCGCAGHSRGIDGWARRVGATNDICAHSLDRAHKVSARPKRASSRSELPVRSERAALNVNVNTTDATAGATALCFGTHGTQCRSTGCRVCRVNVHTGHTGTRIRTLNGTHQTHGRQSVSLRCSQLPLATLQMSVFSHRTARFASHAPASTLRRAI
jgi:ferredoxin